MFKRFDNVSKVAFINFFSSLYFYLPILTIYYQRRELNFVQINSLWGILTGIIFLAEIPTGVIADKIGRKRSIVIALALQLLGEVLFLFAGNYLHFIFISTIAGVGFAFQSGCIQALVYDSLKEHKRQHEMKQATGKIGAFFHTGHLIGAFTSSIIVSQLTDSRIVLAILLTATSVAIAFFISLFLKEPTPTYVHVEESPIKLVKNAFSLIKNNPSLRRIVLLGVLTTPFEGYLRNFHPPYFQLAKISPVWLGISLAIGGIVAILSSKYAYRVEKRLGVEKGMFIATMLPGILYLTMSMFFHPVFSAILFMMNFGLMNIQNPLFADYYNIHIESKVRATTLSTINMISSAYIAIIGLVIGRIADVAIPYAFLFMGVVVITGAVLFRVKEQHVRVSS